MLNLAVPSAPGELQHMHRVDYGVGAVGYQAHDPSLQEHPNMVLDALVKVVPATGRIGVDGVYRPMDEGAATEDAKHGRYGVDNGTAFAIAIGSGQCPVMRYNRWLRDLIIRGPGPPVPDHLPPMGLDDAVDARSSFSPAKEHEAPANRGSDRGDACRTSSPTTGTGPMPGPHVAYRRHVAQAHRLARAPRHL